MTDLRAQRKMAASLLKKGVNGIWVDPEETHKVTLAVTREDVNKLIHDGFIKSRKVVGTSRVRARAQKFKRARGQRKGPGSRKGTANARSNMKRKWINKIRSQRLYLKSLRDDGYISPATYRKLYLQAKGNLFRSVRYLSNYIREHNLALKRLPELKK
ncbi:MAG: 50S ribosomal protein L19e [Candidatus Heimdallarchaeota archaeon]|nr:50S ribosomal protein L19e [Candidatus Heimdallarchaeota archaeon]MDH5644600.1 50S ribosomal protein L19e [Candidatus Heimdallarchaeota archaeon]